MPLQNALSGRNQHHLRTCAMGAEGSSAVVGDQEISLARLWEGDANIRERVRFNGGYLLEWPKLKDGKIAVSQQSMPALGMNGFVMKYVAQYWCPKQSTPKTPHIDFFRKEAGMFQTQRVNK